ncbi:HEAT repeat domain-containing protein [Lyngbya sp. CCY1209]|uniref:HEAT repeat domain-containing protein n=1 Tax=Lyngbya sp. CCY1209 TaxID=2886103 RepID=UPI002D20738B|nr:HEAT repeat domain-containing protein [Lyngbya sp. CCY1209]MEB3885365.1 HEAT repeat domain-containing protein [Lyngbya sp. CCY1209]
MINQLLERATVATRRRDWADAIDALQQFSIDAPSHPEAVERAIALALTVLEGGDFQARWDVAKLLPKLGARSYLPLTDIIRDEDADLEYRWFAGRILGDFDTPEAIASLLELLDNSEDEELREIAASALAHLGASAVEGLCTLLEDSEKRLFAVRALAQIRQKAAVEPLLGVAKDADERIRAIAIEALASFRDPRIFAVLIDALGDYTAAVRKEAAVGLGLRAGQVRDPEFVVDRLKPLLYDVNGDVCKQTAIAIGRYRTDNAIAVLSEVLRSQFTPVPLQIAIVRCLAWMEMAPALDCLRESLPHLDDRAILETIRVVGRVETPNLKKQAGDLLADFFASGHPAGANAVLKQSLAHALGQLGDVRAVGVLEVLVEDLDPGVRYHAIAALKRLAIVAS